MLKVLGKVFLAIGKALVHVFKVAEERGLTEDIVNQAEGLVGEALQPWSAHGAAGAVGNGCATQNSASPGSSSTPTRPAFGT